MSTYQCIGKIPKFIYSGLKEYDTFTDLFKSGSGRLSAGSTTARAMAASDVAADVIGNVGRTISAVGGVLSVGFGIWDVTSGITEMVI